MTILATRHSAQMASKKPRSSTAPKSKDLEQRRVKQAQLNLRVTDFAHELLNRIAAKHGLSKTAALEYSIRQTARAEGVYNAPETTSL